MTSADDGRADRDGDGPGAAPGAHACYQAALSAYAEADLQRAARHLHDALALDPDHAASLHLSAVIAHRTRGVRDAIALYRRAAALDPGVAEHHGNLAVALQELGESAQAIACYRQALAIAPGHPDIRVNLGNALRSHGDVDAAVACYQEVLRARSGHAAAWLNLGNARLAQGDAAAAVVCFERCIAIAPDGADAYHNLGAAHLHLGDLDEAARRYREAAALRPDSAAAHGMLGTVLLDQQRAAQALECFDRAIAASPGNPEARRGRALALSRLGRVTDAAACLRALVAERPADAAALVGLGNACMAAGEVDEALACLRRAVAADPGNEGASSNLLMHMNCDPGVTGAQLLAAHSDWEARHVAPLAIDRPVHANTREPERRLRIGYVSADLRAHPVAYFVQPVLEAHDRDRFEIVGYTNSHQRDDDTARVRSLCDAWHDITALSPADAAARIRADGIDILVDLMGHSSRHRLLTYARRPAPLQVTWLGYPNTTGLTAIDYLIADATVVPPGAEDGFAERILRLPNCLWCYRGLPDAPPVGALPASHRGYLTFGCFNHPGKLSAGVYRAWGAIMRALPDSRLLLKYSFYADGGVRERCLERLAAVGIARERVEMQPSAANPAYLAAYDGVDIALDSFPYSGGTITCDALWMGVPVVTRVSDRMPGRLSASMLRALDLEECIAGSGDDYVRRALALARDPQRLAALRSGLRERVVRSTLGDTLGFTRDLESAYRRVWRQWCNEIPSG